MSGIDFGIDGVCEVARLADDYFVVRMSVLMDSPACPELVDLDVYARVDYGSFRGCVVAAVPRDCGKYGWGVTPELEKWCEKREIESFFAELLQEHYDMECPS